MCPFLALSRSACVSTLHSLPSQLIASAARALLKGHCLVHACVEGLITNEVIIDTYKRCIYITLKSWPNLVTKWLICWFCPYDFERWLDTHIKMPTCLSLTNLSMSYLPRIVAEKASNEKISMLGISATWELNGRHSLINGTHVSVVIEISSMAKSHSNLNSLSIVCSTFSSK